jgi:glycosyltransferase involved in cell wall biosynthesis
MDALVVLPWGRRLGGAEEMMWMLLRHIDRSRVEPRLVFLEEGQFERELAACGFATDVIDAGRLRQPVTTVGAVRALSRLVRRERPDVVLNWSAKTHLYGGLATRGAGGIPVIWWQHAVPDGQWLDRAATALPAAAVGCSSHASASAQEQLRPRRSTFVVHPGIELPYPTTAEEREIVRAELDIPADRIVVGLVGRLEPRKGQDRFLQGLARIHDDGVPVHGLVVGGDAYGLAPKYSESIRELVTRLGLERNVTMTGQVPDAARLVSAMDVLVNASDSEPEPFGIVLLEAMGRGIPTVAVARGGPAEIIDDGRSGVLLPRAAPDLIAAAVRTIVADPELRIRLSAGGRERVKALFTAERMADRFQAEIEHAVEGVGA